jgi:AraC-like DNA-binding protein
MEMSLFWNVIFIAAFSQGFFVSIILLVQFIKSKLKSQLFLGLFIFCFSYILLNNTIYWNGLLERFPHFLFTTTFLRYALAPLFAMYCFTFFKRPISIWSYLHFLPAALLLLCYLPYAFFSGVDKFQIALGNYESISIGWPLQITGWAFFPVSIHLVLYGLLLFFLIKSERKRLEAERDEMKVKQMRWLGFLNTLFLIYGVMMLLYVALVLNNTGGIEKDYYISVAMCIAVYGISAVGILNPDLLRGEPKIAVSSKYDRTRMKSDLRKDINQMLTQAMADQELFLDPDLSLAALAKQLGIPKHHISQTLSLEQEETFNEFLNRYRVRYAQTKLDSMSNGDTIKEIMYASGFNNRVSFNNNFKKVIGSTATEYLNAKKNGSITAVPNQSN